MWDNCVEICTLVVYVVATSRYNKDIWHFIYSLINWWTFGLFLLFSCYEQCCSEHCEPRFIWIYALIMFQGVNLWVHISLRAAKLFLKWLHNYTSSRTVYEGSSDHSSSPTITAILIIGILLGRKWYTLPIFLWISLVINIEHIFMWWLSFCISFLEKCLLITFAHFKLVFFFSISIVEF